MTSFQNLHFNLGDRRLIDQRQARQKITRVIHSARVGHAYLLSGPAGSGKTALALAFAELLNGIDNLTDLGSQAFSKKSSWLNHPDIHFFLPVPTDYNIDNMRQRLALLNDDPYEIADFSLRPSLTDEESTKNKQAFYPINFFNEEIRPKAYLKPNEGRKTVIILTNIEMMRKEAANAFLKLLEEPADNLVFLLTTGNLDHLLPTIISRCQHIQLSALGSHDIQQALIDHDKIPAEEAQYLAQVSGGNYAMARFFDIDVLRAMREDIITFLRKSYAYDAVALTEKSKEWQNEHNIEGQIALLNVMETLLRDLYVWRETHDPGLITNVNQLETIKNFCKALGDAKLEAMIRQLNKCRPLLYQYVQPKLIYTVLAFRFAALMRGTEPEISDAHSWQHLPAYID